MNFNKIQINFVLRLLLIYLALHYFFEFWIGLCAPGGLYWDFANQHLNFIAWYRNFLIWGAQIMTSLAGLKSISNATSMLIVAHGGVKIVYSCLGYGIISLLIAFGSAVPHKRIYNRLIFILVSILLFSLFNMLRLFVVAFYAKKVAEMTVDHHDIFNWLCYMIIFIGMYFWMNQKNTLNQSLHAGKSTT
jgi:exosortase/archaeosortase family protein